MTWRQSRTLGLWIAAAVTFWFFKSNIEITPTRAQAASYRELAHIKPYQAPLKKISPHPLAKIENRIEIESIPQDPRSKLLRAVCELPYLDSEFRPDSSSNYYGFNDGENLAILIQSPWCPEGTHSQIHANRTGARWTVHKSLDCRSANPVDLYDSYRVKGTFTYTGNSKTDGHKKPYDLAIDGRGEFLVHCDQGFVATRYGHFTMDEFNLFRDDQGCILLDENLVPANPFSTDGSNPAIIDLASPGVLEKNLIEPGRVSIQISADESPFQKEVSIVRDYLEIKPPNLDATGLPIGLFQPVDFEKDCN